MFPGSIIIPASMAPISFNEHCIHWNALKDGPRSISGSAKERGDMEGQNKPLK